jgi:hypothetical protein
MELPMKLIYTTTAAIALLSAPALADTSTVFGCEVVQATNGNYYNLVDPTCNFSRLVAPQEGQFDPANFDDEEEEEEAQDETAPEEEDNADDNGQPDDVTPA